MQKWEYLYAAVDYGSNCVMSENGQPTAASGQKNPSLSAYLTERANAYWELISSSSPSGNVIVLFFRRLKA